MKTPSITLRRTLDMTMKDTFKRLNELNEKDSKALREEYREWIEASEGLEKQPHILYMNKES